MGEVVENTQTPTPHPPAEREAPLSVQRIPIEEEEEEVVQVEKLSHKSREGGGGGL